MILAIDAGNTRIKWGLHDGAGWLRTGALPTAEAAAIAGQWAGAEAVSRVEIANVAGAAVAEALRASLVRFAAPVRFAAGREQQCGLRSAYDDPRQLGADRWAAAIGAWDRARCACVVVNAGTALTADAVSEDGVFLGGIIVPGLDLMRRSLTEHTAQLRDIDGQVGYFPGNTADAITSGAVHALCGAIERMAGFVERTSGSPPPCIISGGTAALIEPHLQIEVRSVENLVLEGLVVMAREP